MLFDHIREELEEGGRLMLCVECGVPSPLFLPFLCSSHSRILRLPVSRCKVVTGSWGLLLSGLGDIRVLQAIEGLPGVAELPNYRFAEERGGWEEGGLRRARESARMEKGHGKVGRGRCVCVGGSLWMAMHVWDLPCLAWADDRKHAPTSPCVVCPWVAWAG